MLYTDIGLPMSGLEFLFPSDVDSLLIIADHKKMSFFVQLTGRNITYWLLNYQSYTIFESI